MLLRARGSRSDKLIGVTTPYRDGKKLDAVIPPDRRRQRAIMLVIGGMVGGVALIEGFRYAMQPSSEPAPPIGEPTSSRSGAVTREEIETVVARERADLRNRCFAPQSQLTKANVTLDIVIGKSGEVLSTHYEGSDARVTECVDREVRQWRFPAHSQDSPTTRIPFLFERS